MALSQQRLKHYHFFILNSSFYNNNPDLKYQKTKSISSHNPNPSILPYSSMPLPLPSYPPQLYPHTKTQLQQILTDYYSLTLQLQTLQRHILKIQTQNQHKHKLFIDQVEKLKLYIDQCENEIKKRQQRELLLIERLKELESSRCQEMEVLRFSRNQRKGNEEMLVAEWENVVREKQEEWNRERGALIGDNEAVSKENKFLSKEITALKIVINQVQIQKERLGSEYLRLKVESGEFEKQVTRLTQQLQLSELNIQKLQQQNHLLGGQIQQLTILKENSLRQLSRQQQVLPISSSCLNCLKLTKLHESQIEKKTQQIDSLKKDVESLLAFFDLSQ